MRVCTSKSEGKYSARKQVGNKLLSCVKAFRYFGVLDTSESKIGQLDWCSVHINADIVLNCWGEKGAKNEDETLDLTVIYILTIIYGH